MDLLRKHHTISILEISKTLNISYSSKEFSRSKNDNIQYVGASKIVKSEVIPEKIDKEHKNIFYSSGTLFWDINQINTILKFVENEKIRLHITKANILPEINLPKNVTIYDFSDDKEIFPHMDLIISQGGMGTASKAIRAGIPLIVTPLFFANFSIANNVENYKNGAGILPDNFNFDLLNGKVNEILDNKDYYNKAKMLKESFDNLGGSEKAADLIEEIGHQIEL